MEQNGYYKIVATAILSSTLLQIKCKIVRSGDVLIALLLPVHTWPFSWRRTSSNASSFLSLRLIVRHLRRQEHPYEDCI